MMPCFLTSINCLGERLWSILEFFFVGDSVKWWFLVLVSLLLVSLAWSSILLEPTIRLILFLMVCLMLFFLVSTVLRFPMYLIILIFLGDNVSIYLIQNPPKVSFSFSVSEDSSVFCYSTILSVFSWLRCSYIQPAYRYTGSGCLWSSLWSRWQPSSKLRDYGSVC